MPKQNKLKRIFHLFLFVSLVILIVSFSILLTQYVANNENAQLLIQEFGHIGIIIISFLIGVSGISPVPAGTFTPIFTASGIHIITVITLAVVGTMLANLASYYIGRLGHKFTNANYPKIQEKVVALYSEKKKLIPYFVFMFSGFVPFPDEIYLIPFGVMGVKIKEFIIPLILGTTLFQTATALGFNSIFQIILG